MLAYTASPISEHVAAEFNDQELVTDHKLQLEDFWKLETLAISEPVSANDDDETLQPIWGRYLEGRISMITN